MRTIVIFVGLFVAGPVPSTAQKSADLGAEIHGWFQRLEARHGFSGTVHVARRGETLLNAGYGLADDAANEPMTAATVLLSGSISKQFTAAAILLLEQRGLLRTGDSISQHLSDVPADKRSITIHQLMTHSAGFAEDHFDSDLTPMTRTEAVDAILALRPGGPPGEAYDYSNTGYALLAVIIEEVTGRRFTDFIAEELFEPLGLDDTGFFDDDWSSAAVAMGYRNGEAWGRPSDHPGPYWGIMGNGGVMTTAEDLYLWYAALRGGLVLDSARTGAMFTAHVSRAPAPDHYGYGWVLAESPQGALITHSGLGLGGNADIAEYVDQELVIVVMSNRAWYDPRDGTGYLPATNARRVLAANVVAGDFSTLPDPPPSAAGASRGRAMAIIAALLAAAIAFATIRRRVRPTELSTRSR